MLGKTGAISSLHYTLFCVGHLMNEAHLCKVEFGNKVVLIACVDSFISLRKGNTNRENSVFELIASTHIYRCSSL
jgi:hypothetical protein